MIVIDSIHALGMIKLSTFSFFRYDKIKQSVESNPSTQNVSENGVMVTSRHSESANLCKLEEKKHTASRFYLQNKVSRGNIELTHSVRQLLVVWRN